MASSLCAMAWGRGWTTGDLTWKWQNGKEPSQNGCRVTRPGPTGVVMCGAYRLWGVLVVAHLPGLSGKVFDGVSV
jgi:hypothetical protein